MVSVRQSSLVAGAAGGLATAAVFALVAAYSSTDAEAERLSGVYAATLLRELVTDRGHLESVRDSLAGEHALALMWVDWIDERQVVASHTLMEAGQNLAEPVDLALRDRVVGELDRRGHWSAVPDAALREDLVRYHALAVRFDGVGAAESLSLRTWLSEHLERAEWNWMFDVPAEDPGFVRFKDSVRSLATPEFRSSMRLMSIGIADRVEWVDRILELNVDLTNRVRAWSEAT
jgi:hypothetical protein